jgi:hypothetical protein
MLDQYGNPIQPQMPVLGEDQQMRLAQMLRNQPNLPQMQNAPTSEEMIQNAQKIKTGYDNLVKAGNGDAWNGLKSKVGLWSAPKETKYGVIQPNFSNVDTGIFGGLYK